MRKKAAKETAARIGGRKYTKLIRTTYAILKRSSTLSWVGKGTECAGNYMFIGFREYMIVPIVKRW
jgi:hypothetical protein